MAPAQGPNEALLAEGLVYFSLLCLLLSSLPRGAATLSDSIPFCKFGNRSQDVQINNVCPF